MSSFIYIVRNAQAYTQTDTLTHAHRHIHIHTQGTTMTEKSMNLKKILWVDFREDRKGGE